MTARRIGFDAAAFVAEFAQIAATHGMSIYAACMEIGVHNATTSRMKTRGGQPDVASMLAMAVWAGIDPRDYFIDREDDEVPA